MTPNRIAIASLCAALAFPGTSSAGLVTWELEAASLYDLKDRHVPILIDLMTGQFELEK